jgi:predicted MPP superfamily phosphohydrolase
MRTLVIPDLHNHIDSADEWIARFPADRIVFLGDYFDSFGDTVAMARATAAWLRDSLARPERVHLWGNHDLAYAFPQNPDLHCSGFTAEKATVIREILSPAHWQQLRLVSFEAPNFLLVHAGLQRALFEHPIEGITAARLEARCAQALDNARASLPDPILGPRGLVWLRWWNLDLLPEFNQVVGHTPQHELQIERSPATFNICLDTMGRYVGLIEDGQFAYADTRTGEITPVRTA